jgi:hypothetical protein
VIVLFKYTSLFYFAFLTVVETLWPAVAPILHMQTAEKVSIEVNLPLYWHGLDLLHEVCASHSVSPTGLAFTASTIQSVFPIISAIFKTELRNDQLLRLMHLVWFCRQYSFQPSNSVDDFLLSALPDIFRFTESSLLRDITIEFLLVISAASPSLVIVVAQFLCPCLSKLAAVGSAATASAVLFPIVWAFQPVLVANSASLLTAALQNSCDILRRYSSKLVSLFSEQQFDCEADVSVFAHISALLARWCTPSTKFDGVFNSFEAKLLKSLEFSFNHK